MPGKQKDSRTRVTIALERELEGRIKAEVRRRRDCGQKADQSGFISEAISWYLQQLMKIFAIDAIVRFAISTNAFESAIIAACDEGQLGWYGVKLFGSACALTAQVVT